MLLIAYEIYDYITDAAYSYKGVDHFIGKRPFMMGGARVQNRLRTSARNSEKEARELINVINFFLRVKLSFLQRSEQSAKFNYYDIQ